MIDFEQERRLAVLCLAALVGTPPWCRCGRPTKKGEARIQRILDGVSSQVIKGGLSALCENHDELMLIVRGVVQQMLNMRPAARPRAPRSRQPSSTRRVAVRMSSSSSLALIKTVPMWTDGDGNEYHIWVPNPNANA